MREEHAILDGITLPFDDKFWDEFFPPNGWNCRCEAIQVSKKRYEPSNPSEALARGRAATYKPNADGVNKAAIFRFNPGKEHIIFMDKHPYFKTNDAKRIRSILNPNNEYTRIWKSDKNNGAIYSSTPQNDGEVDKNFELAKHIAEENNEEILMLGIFNQNNGKTNPDSYNITRGVIQEYKVPDMPNGITEYTIRRNIRKAKRQSTHIVIKLNEPEGFDEKKTIKYGVIEGLRNTSNIQEVIIVDVNNKIHSFNRDVIPPERRKGQQ